jgi:hypothetical protein
MAMPVSWGKMTILLAFVGVAVGSVLPAMATESAWPVRKGSTYVEFQPYLGGYSNDTQTPVTEFSLRNRIEVGYTDSASWFVSLPFRTLSRTQGEDIFTNNGLTDIHTGTYIQLLRFPFSLTLKGALKIPTGYNQTFMPVIGGRQLDAELGLLAGYAFEALPLMVQGGLGYRLRSGYDPDHAVVAAAARRNQEIKKPADEIPFFLETGFWFIPQAYVGLGLQGSMALNQEKAWAQSQVFVTPTLAWRFNNYADLSLQLEQAIWSQNAPFSTGVMLGLHVRYGDPLALNRGLRGTDEGQVDEP